MIITFSVPFVVAKSRPRLGRYGTYTPKKTAEAEDKIRTAYKGVCIRKYGKVVTAPKRKKVMVAATFRTATPKTRPKWMPKALWDKGVVPFITKPDIDNCLKTCLDALNPVKHKDGSVELIAWHDDSQVVETHAYKLDRIVGYKDQTFITVFWEDDDG